MRPFVSVMLAWVPVCMSFGPLFLVIAGKSPKAERFLRMTGVAMVTAALMALWLVVDWQRGEISLLQTRLQRLEERVPGGAREAAVLDSRP